MANEPERPIEKLLRAAAQQRRDEAGAPLELHPATRRLLQGEVARRFARPGLEPCPFFEVLGRLWPRFAWAVAICAVLGVMAYMLLPVPGKGRPEAQLARNEPLPQAAPAKPAPPPSPAAAPLAPTAAAESNPSEVALAAPAPATPRMAREEQPLAKDTLSAHAEPKAKQAFASAAALRPSELKKPAESEIAASGGSLGQAAVGPADGTVQRRFKSAASPVPPASMPSEPAAPPSTSLTTRPAPVTVAEADQAAGVTVDRAGQATFADKPVAPTATAKPAQVASDMLRQPAANARPQALGLSFAQRYTQVVPGQATQSGLGSRAESPPPVLASFQVEQTGSELRIVDGDGSVYSGYVQTPEALMRRRSVQAAESAAGQASGVATGALKEQAPARLDAAHLAPQTCFFRVAGTNRSLNQEVVFTGNLTTVTNPASFQPLTKGVYSLNRISAAPAGAPQPSPPEVRTRISGKVVVGKGKAIEIDALPSSP